MITLFTCPKSFTGKFKIYQTNAILSWINVNYGIEILILGNDKGVKEFCLEYNLKNIKDIKKGIKGIPLINDIFLKAQNFSSNNILVYLNSDIIITNSFINAILSIWKRNFFLIGQRTDIDFDYYIDFNKNWENSLKKYAENNGRLLSPTGMDYFVFKKGLFKQDLPPFLIGRTLWDPYLVYYAKEKGCELIDITHDAPVYHPRHDYSHANQTKEELWNSKEAEINRKLCGGKIANITNCRYKLVKGKLIPFFTKYSTRN
jgi:hypothetical protein